LLTRNELGGKLGLIDMGQVKRLSLEDRIKFAKLVLALAQDDDSQASTSRIAKLWRECGFVSKYNNEEVVADHARFFFDRMDDDLMNKYGGAAVAMEQMDHADPVLKLPDDFVMCMRSSVLLRMNAMVSLNGYLLSDLTKCSSRG
jgi:aarF domain-containing kinase